MDYSRLVCSCKETALASLASARFSGSVAREWFLAQTTSRRGPLLAQPQSHTQAAVSVHDWLRSLAAL